MTADKIRNMNDNALSALLVLIESIRGQCQNHIHSERCSQEGSLNCTHFCKSRHAKKALADFEKAIEQ